MISKEMKNSLMKFFSELIRCEKSSQINRQILCESADFDAYQIFNYLKSDNNNITLLDIKKYLNENGIEITDQEAKLIILFYDINSDGKLSYDEFINLIRSEKSSFNIKSFRIQDSNLSFNINYSLCKLFQKEIEVSKRIISSLKELRNKKEFNIHNLYHILKSNTFITEQSLKNFLSENDFDFIDSDIKLLMRRLDLNKDNKIDFCEFHSLLSFDKCQSKCLIKNKCQNCGLSYCKECFIENHGCNSIHNKYSINKIDKKYNIENKDPNILIKEENINNSNNNDIKENEIEIKELNDYIKFLL